MNARLAVRRQSVESKRTILQQAAMQSCSRSTLRYHVESEQPRDLILNNYIAYTKRLPALSILLLFQ